MKTAITMMLLGSLLLAGCAKTAVESQPTATDSSAAAVQATTDAKSSTDAKPATDATAAASTGSVQKIFFDFDSYLLTPASKEVLQKNARVLLAQPEVRITIEGHTDERGSSAYNLALGERRAQAARNYLQTLGIAPERINVVSYGQEKPAQTGANEEAWAQNRRAEFVTAN